MQQDMCAHNIGFTAMLAEEYILIVPFAYHLQFGLNESRMVGTGKAEQQNITSIVLTLLSIGSG
jgi:hypothetical protein